MSSNAGPDIVSDGLFFLVDAGDKKSYPGSGTTWTDRASNIDGTFINGPLFVQERGGVVEFDGSNDYADFNVTKSAECTIVVWAKADSLGSMMFNAGNSGAGPDLYFNHGVISWNTWDGGNNSFGAHPESIKDNNYHHYTIVCDTSTSTATLYIDGEVFGTANHGTNPQNGLTGSDTLSIGGNSGNYIWNGSIARFAMYNKTLTADEVLQNYRATKSRFS